VRSAADAAETAKLLDAAPPGDRVALVDPRFIGHVHSLRLGLTDPRFPAAAVPGALTAQPEARAALGRALRTAPLTAPDEVAAALAAEGVSVQRPELGSLVAVVPGDQASRTEAEQAVAAVDDEAIRLRTAVKSRDGFFTTYCISPYSRYLARWCARRGLTPNQVTTASLITALIAAGCAATGTRGGYVAAGILLLLSFVLDCTDGQLARYSLQYSTMGAWLDATFDRAKEYAYYVGLALGAIRGGDDVWALALGAMVLQSCRHVVDFSFNEANHDATGNTSPTAALSGKLDSVGWTVWVRRMIVLPIGERWAMIAVLTAVTTPRIVFYALLIGCAFAACYTTAGRVLRSVTRRAIRTDRAAQALADLADSGPLAHFVARGGSVLSISWFPPVMALIGTGSLLTTVLTQPFGARRTVIAAGVYAAFAGCAVALPLKGALDWLIPPLFRIAEYCTILALAVKADVAGALPAAFGLIAAVAYHHYDTVYRIKGGTGAPPNWLVRTLGGHEGRTLLVTVLAALSATIDFPLALTVLAVAVALVAGAESIRFWVSSGAPAVHDEGEIA
jgi:phosphatidylglycerophosphate synthase